MRLSWRAGRLYRTGRMRRGKEKEKEMKKEGALMCRLKTGARVLFLEV